MSPDEQAILDRILPWFKLWASGYIGGIGEDEHGELWISPYDLAEQLAALGLRASADPADTFEDD